MVAPDIFKKLKKIPSAPLTPVETCELLAQEPLPDGGYMYFYKLTRHFGAAPDCIISNQRLNGICIRGASVALEHLSFDGITQQLGRLEDAGCKFKLHPIFTKLMGAKSRVKNTLGKMYAENKIRTLYTESPDDVYDSLPDESKKNFTEFKDVPVRHAPMKKKEAQYYKLVHKLDIDSKLLSEYMGIAQRTASEHKERAAVYMGEKSPQNTVRFTKDTYLIGEMRRHAEKWKTRKYTELAVFFNKFYSYPRSNDATIITKNFPDTPIENIVQPMLSQNNVNEHLVNLSMARIPYLKFNATNQKLLKHHPWVMVLSPSNFAKTKLFELATGQPSSGAVNKISTWTGYEIKDKSKCHRGTLEELGCNLVVDEFEQSGFALDELKIFSRSGTHKVAVNEQHIFKTTTSFIFLANITIPSSGGAAKNGFTQTIYSEFSTLLEKIVRDYQSVFARCYLFIPNTSEGVKGRLKHEDKIESVLRIIREPLSDVLSIVLQDHDVRDLIEGTPIPSDCSNYYKECRSIGRINIYAEISAAKLESPHVDFNIALARSLFCFSYEEIDSIVSAGTLSQELKEKLFERFTFWAHYFCQVSKSTISLLMDGGSKALPVQQEFEIKKLIEESTTQRLYCVTAMLVLECTFQSLQKLNLGPKGPKGPKGPTFSWGCVFRSIGAHHKDLIDYVLISVRNTFNDQKIGVQSVSKYRERGDRKSAISILNYLEIGQNIPKSGPKEILDLSSDGFGPSSKMNICDGYWYLTNPNSARSKVIKFFDLYPEYKFLIQPIVGQFDTYFNENLNMKDILDV